MIRAAASRFGDVLFLVAVVIVVVVVVVVVGLEMVISSVDFVAWYISSFSSIIFLASSDVFDLSFLNLFVDVVTGLDTDVDVDGKHVFKELLLASRGLEFFKFVGGELKPGS